MIFIHWLEQTGILQVEDISMIAALLNIPESLLTIRETRKRTTTATYCTNSGLEAVFITIPEYGHGRVRLGGSFFDAFPDQSIQGFKDFMYSREGNCKRLDISIKDTNGIIDFAEYKRMSALENYRDYCSGSSVTDRKRKKGEVPDSNNRGGIPDPHGNHSLIHFGDGNSSSFAKLYVCTDGLAKFEITLKNHTQTKILLDAYDINDMTRFNDLAKGALVKCIDFITPASKRQKRHQQIESYRQFLGADTKPVQWTTYSPEKRKLTVTESLKVTTEKIIGLLWNCIPRFDIPQHDIEVITAEIRARLVPPDFSVWERSEVECQ